MVLFDIVLWLCVATIIAIIHYLRLFFSVIISSLYKIGIFRMINEVKIERLKFLVIKDCFAKNSDKMKRNTEDKKKAENQFVIP